MKSLIIIMSIGREHINVNFCLENAIYQTMFLGYLTTPAILRLSFQWFRMSSASLRMLSNLIEQFDNFLERCRFATLQFGKSLLGFRRISNSVFH